MFATSGGVMNGVANLAKRNNVNDFKGIIMSGINDIKKHMTLLNIDKSEFNFFEGMACCGGCINGPLCINMSKIKKEDIDKYAQNAKEKEIDRSLELENKGKIH
jgi:iron only hydrogenase large subunit-like protein